MTCLRPYWISWHDRRPWGTFELHSPWWVTSDYSLSDSRTLCAAVMARNAAAAKAIIRAAYDRPPRTVNWRFVSRQPPGWSPFGERFPREGWMHWSGTETAGNMN